MLAGCAQTSTPPPTATMAPAAKVAMGLTPTGFDSLPGWADDHVAEALAPFIAGCAKITDAAWMPVCDRARQVPPRSNAAARAFFEANFQPNIVTADGTATGLFTGYYEPEVQGARTPSAAYAVPLLSPPKDLVQVDLGAFSDELKGKRITGRIQGGTLVPYHDRAAIAAGALRAQHLELLWLRNPVDAFFLEIQGSGRVKLPDGAVVRITYAGQNGRGYVPIGRVLAQQGAIPLAQVSMQSIRAWLESHPTEAPGVMNRNPSYVFFRELSGVRTDEGPPGALGAALTPMRSAAVDRSFIPLGAPIYIDTTDATDGTPIQRLMVAQDTGGAIKGPVRADIFFGWGPAAEDHAGRMRQPGRQYLLLPKAAPAS